MRHTHAHTHKRKSADLTFLILASFSFSRASFILSAFVWGSLWKHRRTLSLLTPCPGNSDFIFSLSAKLWFTICMFLQDTSVPGGGGRAVAGSCFWVVAGGAVWSFVPPMFGSEVRGSCVADFDSRSAIRASRSLSSSSLSDSVRRCVGLTMTSRGWVGESWT